MDDQILELTTQIESYQKQIQDIEAIAEKFRAKGSYPEGYSIEYQNKMTVLTRAIASSQLTLSNLQSFKAKMEDPERLALKAQVEAFMGSTISDFSKERLQRMVTLIADDTITDEEKVFLISLA